MDFTEILKKRRTIRRFKQDEIPFSVIKELIDAAAISPSGRNAQPLRYILIKEKSLLKDVFEQTAWGGSVQPHRNPEFGVTAPTAFLAVCTEDQTDQQPSQLALVDSGAAIQTILFRAADLGLGTCWIGAFNREKVNALLGMDKMTTIYLVALGYPAEEPVLERIKLGDSTKYYLDSEDVLHVPKYAVEEVLTVR